jgi:hypothetical protein
MKTFQELVDLVTENLSDIVWHYTEHPLSILKSNKFSLSTESGADVTKGGKAFFMSTARSKLGSYSESPSGVIFKLDGRKLNQRYKGRPHDYWSGAGFKTREEGKSEMEDRLYSDDPVIENADSYILEIQCWVSEIQKKDNTSPFFLIDLKKLKDIADSKNIPIKFFDGYENFIKNKDPKPSIDDIVDTSKIELPEKYKPRRYSNSEIKDFLNFILLLKDPKGLYRYYDSGIVLGNIYHNEFKRKHSKKAIYVKKLIANLLKKLKIKSIDDLIKLRVEQYNYINRYEDDAIYLKTRLKQIISDMESGKDYDFDLFFDLSRGFFKDIPSSFEKLAYNYRKSDKSGIENIFNQAVDVMGDKIEKIKTTILPTNLKEVPPKKVDYSWRDSQI